MTGFNLSENFRVGIMIFLIFIYSLYSNPLIVALLNVFMTWDYL